MSVTPVLLAGNMCDARLWRGSGAVLASMLSAHFSAEPFDADLTKDASIAQMAARALADTKGRLLPIGFSMGAIVAVEMARQASDRIAGLGLAGFNATADLPDRAARRPVQQAEVRDGGLERVLVEELKPNYLAAANRGDAELLALLRDMGMGLGRDVFVRQSEALRTRDDLRPVLPNLSMPVLYLCGAEDTLCPPEWHRQWVSVTRDARFHEVAGAGHMLPLEAPQQFATLIDHWLTEKDFA